MNKSYLIVIDNINPEVSFPATPWHINNTGYRFHSYELRKDQPCIQLNNYLITPKELDSEVSVEDVTRVAVDNIFKCLYQLNNIMQADGGAPKIYTIHSRNLLGRLVQSWAQFRNLQFNVFRTAHFIDLVEAVNQPAVMTAEERCYFDYERFSVTVGKPMPKDPIELVLETCQTFLL